MDKKFNRQELAEVDRQLDALSYAFDTRTAVDLLRALEESMRYQRDSKALQDKHVALINRLIDLMTAWLWTLSEETARRQLYRPLLAMLRRGHSLSWSLMPAIEKHLTGWAERLDHTERIQRLLATDVLVGLESSESFSALLARLDRPDYAFRDEIARGMRSLVASDHYRYTGIGSRLFEEWLQRLSADDKALRALASRELTWLASHDWFSYVRREFWAKVWAKSENEDQALRIAAACQLVGTQAGTAPAAWLLERLDQLGRADARRVVARLARHADARLAPHWLALLKHPDMQLRGFAAKALEQALKQPDVRQALLDTLTDKDPEVALEAALSLRTLPLAREDLSAWAELMLQSGSERYQAQALTLIGKARMLDFRASVMELAKYGSTRLQLKAVHVLGRLGDAESEAQLRHMLERGKPSPALRTQLVQALGKRLSKDDADALPRL